MIEKKVRKRPLDDESASADDLAYWLSKTPEERIAEVQRLRRQVYGDKVDAPMQRVVRIVRRSSR